MKQEKERKKKAMFFSFYLNEKQNLYQNGYEDCEWKEKGGETKQHREREGLRKLH
jgi:hypothetical protein